MADDTLTGEALRLHLAHCAGCEECRRPMRASEAREFIRSHPDMDHARRMERYGLAPAKPDDE